MSYRSVLRSSKTADTAERKIDMMEATPVAFLLILFERQVGVSECTTVNTKHLIFYNSDKSTVVHTS